MGSGSGPLVPLLAPPNTLTRQVVRRFLLSSSRPPTPTCLCSETAGPEVPLGPRLGRRSGGALRVHSHAHAPLLPLHGVSERLPFTGLKAEGQVGQGVERIEPPFLR